MHHSATNAFLDNDADGQYSLLVLFYLVLTCDRYHKTTLVTWTSWYPTYLKMCCRGTPRPCWHIRRPTLRTSRLRISNKRRVGGLGRRGVVGCGAPSLNLNLLLPSKLRPWLFLWLWLCIKLRLSCRVDLCTGARFAQEYKLHHQLWVSPPEPGTRNQCAVNARVSNEHISPDPPTPVL